MNTPALVKERLLWCIYLGITFFLLYGAANHYAALTAPHPAIYMEWEHNIPFIALFIIPYMASDLMFILAFSLKQSRLELRILAARVLFIIVVSVLCFILLPLQFAFTKPPIQEYALLFNLLQADLPYNQLPSLHVSFAIILYSSMSRHTPSKFIKSLLAVSFILIIISTLLVYQHHFWDIPTGALVGFGAIYLIRHNPNSTIVRCFSTPRHLKMALYYLVATIILLVLAFNFKILAPIWLYLAMCTLAVSIVYAFGFNQALVNKRDKPSILQWLVFLPYFIGTYFNWRLYQNLPILKPLVSNIYIGRQPSTHEYNALTQAGIKHIINLAPEQVFQKTHLTQTRLALLDLTIPAPERIHQAVLALEHSKQELTYLHCALGLARTGIIAGAYLIYQGYPRDELEALIQAAQPRFKAKPYTQVAWDLYEDYLKDNAKIKT
ncbi:phosphatase PAP2 family protein [Thiofilum flexile]|uniref:phosphatase domain-containing putative toxin n=1 Tax=Thiofilum flexile TaxID=125627 RepID=UPI0003743206|nr:phosphatase PAP2 family protein [Thiofilum flexile]